MVMAERPGHGFPRRVRDAPGSREHGHGDGLPFRRAVHPAAVLALDCGRPGDDQRAAVRRPHRHDASARLAARLGGHAENDHAAEPARPGRESGHRRPTPTSSFHPATRSCPTPSPSRQTFSLASPAPRHGRFLRIRARISSSVLSDSTAACHAPKKAEIADQNGIAEYWLADTPAGELTILVLVDGRFAEALAPHGTLTSRVLPELAIPVEAASATSRRAPGRPPRATCAPPSSGARAAGASAPCPAARARQLRDEVDALRALPIVRQVAPAGLGQLVDGRALAARSATIASPTRPSRRRARRSPPRRAPSGGGTLLLATSAGYGAARGDHVDLAVGDEQVAVGVEVAHVADGEVAVAERSARLLGAAVHG